MTLRGEAGGSLQVDPNCCSLPPNILHAHFLSVQARILNVSQFLCLSPSLFASVSAVRCCCFRSRTWFIVATICCHWLLMAMQTVCLVIEGGGRWGRKNSGIVDSENVSTCETRRHKCCFLLRCVGLFPMSQCDFNTLAWWVFVTPVIFDSTEVRELVKVCLYWFAYRNSIYFWQLWVAQHKSD